jgi:hypothetical protein
MELDELKSDLKLKLENTGATRSSNTLEQYIHQRSLSVIDKIKRNLYVEILFCLICLLGFIWIYFHNSSLVIRFFMVLGSITAVLTVVYLATLRKKIILQELTTASIRENLSRIIIILNLFTRVYFQISMIMLPLAFVAGIILGYMNISAYPENMKTFNWSRSLLFYIVFFSGWSILMYFFAKWYIKKLYGNYLQQLKEQLKELENG